VSYRARLAVVEAMVAVASRMASGRYYVRRGPIDYAAFDFTTHPYTCAILCPSFPLRKAPGAHAFEGTFILELTTRMPDDAGAGLDDRRLDGMMKDAELLLEQLERAVNNQGDPIVLRVHNDPPPEAVEQTSADWKVQGIAVTFTVDY
jgi:hypothetical protein